MQSRRKLRYRLIVSFALFGFGLSALFAVASLYVRAKVEDQLVVSALQHDVDQAVDKVIAHPDQQASSELIDAWLWSDRTIYKAPLDWQGLSTGVYDMNDVDEQGRPRHYKLAVRRKDGIIGFVRYDVSREELGKRQLITALVLVVFLFSVLSLAIGVWLSRKVLKPVSELANRLRDFRRAGKAEPLAPHFADDEVGELAHALDEYSARLTAMVERDREFNSDVSHELRTPLAVIASTTELLQGSSNLSDKLLERLKRIERAVRQCSELIDALLLLSRRERQAPTDGETTDVARVVEQVVDAQRPHVANKPVVVRVEVEQPLETVAPSSVVAVALSNLIGNAFKYTQAGEVIVTVGYGRVTIEDTGPGINPQDADKLFERGVRGTTVGKGGGLGLAIVRRLCELYGWNVTLAPRPQGGATATLEFVSPA